MTEAQIKFVELEKKKKEIKKYFEELEVAIKAVQAEIGMNGMFQDPEGTVYRVVKPPGRFVKYEDIGYVRTRRAGEKAGELSLTDARAAGFMVEGK